MGKRVYKYMFRCRMCDKVYEFTSKRGCEIHKIVRDGASRVSRSTPVFMVETHYHKDGSVGVADLIGVQAQEE